MSAELKELEDLIDWPHVLAQPRCSGGHEEVMRSIFGPASQVLAWWHDGDWSGTIAIAHRLSDGRVVIMTDYYGSCSGCDAWESATDEDAKKQVLDLVHNARVFTSVAEAIDWCLNIDKDNKPQEYGLKDAVNLVEQLRQVQ